MQLTSKQAAETSSAESLRYFVPSVKTLGTMRDIPLERPVRLGSTLDVSLRTLHGELQIQDKPNVRNPQQLARTFVLYRYKLRADTYPPLTPTYPRGWTP